MSKDTKDFLGFMGLIIGMILLSAILTAIFGDGIINMIGSLIVLYAIVAIPCLLIAFVSLFVFVKKGNYTNGKETLRRAFLISLFFVSFHLVFSWHLGQLKNEFDAKSWNCNEDSINAVYECNGNLDEIIYRRNITMNNSHFINVGSWWTNGLINTRFMAHIFVPGIKWIKDWYYAKPKVTKPINNSKMTNSESKNESGKCAGC